MHASIAIDFVTVVGRGEFGQPDEINIHDKEGSTVRIVLPSALDDRERVLQRIKDALASLPHYREVESVPNADEVIRQGDRYFIRRHD